MIISAQILSFPHQDPQTLAHHEVGLRGTGKSFYIADNVTAYADQVSKANDFTAPELIFCDYTKLARLARFAFSTDKLSFLQRIPIIVVTLPYPALGSAQKDLKVIGSLDLTDQSKPGRFRQLVADFYQAKNVGTPRTTGHNGAGNARPSRSPASTAQHAEMPRAHDERPHVY